MVTNKSLRLVLAFALVGAIMTAYYAHRNAQARYITNVLNQGSQTVEALTQTPSARMQFSPHKCSVALSMIDTSSCPEKFQVAWLDYVQALNQAPDKNEILFDFVIGTIGVARKSAAWSKWINKAPDAKNDVVKAWQNLERIALDYDVRIVHQIK